MEFQRKIVFKFSMATDYWLRKAMKLVVNINGVVTTTVNRERGELTVQGHENLDIIKVIKALRKGMSSRRLPLLGFRHADTGFRQVITISEVVVETTVNSLGSKTVAGKQPEVITSNYCYCKRQAQVQKIETLQQARECLYLVDCSCWYCLNGVE